MSSSDEGMLATPESPETRIARLELALEREREEKKQALESKKKIQTELDCLKISEKVKSTLTLAKTGKTGRQQMAQQMAATIKETNDFLQSHVIDNQPAEYLLTYIRSSSVIDNLEEVVGIYYNLLKDVISE